MNCVFFGHRDTPCSVQPALENTILRLVEEKGCDNFYVGNNGAFDRMVYDELKKVRAAHPHININVVTAYIPDNANINASLNNDIIYPIALLNMSKNVAITYRNRWMANKADIAVCYINRPRGGAVNAIETVIRNGKPIINLSIGNRTDDF